MATGAAAEMMLRCVLEGSLMMQEMEVERRPYHRNCGCALHNLKGTLVCSSGCSRSKSITFVKKKSWKDCSLAMGTSQFSSQSSLPAGGCSVRRMESKTSRRFCYPDGENMSD